MTISKIAVVLLLVVQSGCGRRTEESMPVARLDDQTLTLEDVHRYQLYLVRDRALSWSSGNQATIALRYQ